MRFEVATYHDQDTGRARLAVYSSESRVWYFPRRYGAKAARALCNRLNK